jgi:hypothetical protein
MFFEPISWSPTCVNRASIEMNHKSVFDAAAFLKARSLVWVEEVDLSQSRRCSFWYYSEVYRQDRSRSDSIWLEIWMFCFEEHVSVLWPYHLSTDSTSDVVMYWRKARIHHQPESVRVFLSL